jgi:putative membrane protein
MSIRQNFLAGLAAVALVAGSAAAQSNQSANRMNGSDAFMTKAAQGGMAEVEMGRVAVQNANNPQVKQFGQRMIDDHSKANDQLKSIAAKKNVTLPTDIDAKQRAEMDRLSKLKGAAFDREYMTLMVKDHKEDVSEFEKASKNESDPDVKSFASSTLPTLQEHLRMAEQTESQVKK